MAQENPIGCLGKLVSSSDQDLKLLVARKGWIGCDMDELVRMAARVVDFLNLKLPEFDVVAHFERTILESHKCPSLVNYLALRTTLEESGPIFNTSSDTEIVLHLIATSKTHPVFLRIIEACERLKGGFSIVFLTEDKLAAVRDPYGFRLLVMEKISNGSIDLIEATPEHEVNLGEALVVDKSRVHSFCLLVVGFWFLWRKSKKRRKTKRFIKDVLELGILKAGGLHPMKTGDGKGKIHIMWQNMVTNGVVSKRKFEETVGLQGGVVASVGNSKEASIAEERNQTEDCQVDAVNAALDVPTSPLKAMDHDPEIYEGPSLSENASKNAAKHLVCDGSSSENQSLLSLMDTVIMLSGENNATSDRNRNSDMLEICEQRGMKFPRPRWWLLEGF
ncbi:hypothetical protein NE237_025787 [Protea cynaroides]|uniref:Glutamine amidotransferase type-2 domain-containing protein n=1 Tax=Protea cynaroides TaxID=273540 RepID=A0A9Q0H4W1_9MAGN|nr:hypothetical protein NE237_025787 [Protea cynaroides]